MHVVHRCPEVHTKEHTLSECPTFYLAEHKVVVPKKKKKPANQSSSVGISAVVAGSSSVEDKQQYVSEVLKRYQESINPSPHWTRRKSLEEMSLEELLESEKQADIEIRVIKRRKLAISVILREHAETDEITNNNEDVDPLGHQHDQN